MIGGKVIEVRRTETENGTPVNRLWCVSISAEQGRFDEVAVYAEPYALGGGPSIGDMIWWQGQRIYFDADWRHVRKIGYSFNPNRMEPA